MKKSYPVLLIFIMAVSQIFAQSGPVKNSDLDSLYDLSHTSLNSYDYKNTIEFGNQLLQEAKSKENGYYKYHAHNLLGAAYQDMEDSIRARRNYESSLRYAVELENDTLLLWAYNNLGNIFSENKKTTQKGIEYYNRVIDLATKIKSRRNILTSTVNIAWTYLDNEEYEKAWPYLDRARELIDEEEDAFIAPQLNTLMGRYFLGVNRLNEAGPYFQEAITMVERDSLILQAAEVHEQYANLLFRQENHKEAFLALEKYNDYNSQIFEKDKITQIEIANAKFDLIQYQRDLEIARGERLLQDEVIKKSRETMIVFIIASIVLLIILLALYKISRSRRKLIAELSEKNEELLKAKEEAERLSILKTKFFSTISHELRTPLYGVIGLTSILMEDKSLVKHENDLKSLKFSADYLLALINDVLQMNKMESNLLKLEKLPFNLNDLLRSIVKSFEFTRLQNENDIHLDIDPGISGNLIGDPVRISQILMNLVGNAMKFTERGNIWIKAKAEERGADSMTVYFEIKDDGYGIPETKQQMIFEEFSQLQSKNYDYQGTGLGLPIVKKLLLLFNSDIHLESEEGKGSLFSFTIKFDKDLKRDDTAITTGNLDPLLPESSGEGKCILIVDDNRINQVVTKRILEQKSFVCEISENGTDAVEKVREGGFDLILMDVNMPGISGLEATNLIREFNKEIPVIALTAVEIEEIRSEIFESGMNDIIVKPYDTSVFYQVIYRNILAEVAST